MVSTLKLKHSRTSHRNRRSVWPVKGTDASLANDWPTRQFLGGYD
jgi:hypothetical protein